MYWKPNRLYIFIKKKFLAPKKTLRNENNEIKDESCFEGVDRKLHEAVALAWRLAVKVSTTEQLMLVTTEAKNNQLFCFFLAPAFSVFYFSSVSLFSVFFSSQNPAKWNESLRIKTFSRGKTLEYNPVEVKRHLI